MLETLEIVLSGLASISLFLQVLAFYYFGAEWKWMKRVRNRFDMTEKETTTLKSGVSISKDRVNSFREEINRIREFVQAQLERAKEFF